jgi:hypothetical protein
VLALQGILTGGTTAVQLYQKMRAARASARKDQTISHNQTSVRATMWERRKKSSFGDMDALAVTADPSAAPLPAWLCPKGGKPSPWCGKDLLATLIHSVGCHLSCLRGQISRRGRRQQLNSPPPTIQDAAKPTNGVDHRRRFVT